VTSTTVTSYVETVFPEGYHYTGPLVIMTTTQDENPQEGRKVFLQQLALHMGIIGKGPKVV